VFGAGGDVALTSSDDRSARLWSADGRLLHVLGGHRSEVLWSELSPDGRLVLTASADNSARVWDAATGRLVVPLIGHRERVRWGHFSADGKTVLTAGTDGVAKLWRAEDPGELRRVVAPGPVAWVGYDGAEMVTLDEHSVLTHWGASGVATSSRRIEGLLQYGDGQHFGVQVGARFEIQRGDGSLISELGVGDAPNLVFAESDDGRVLAIAALGVAQTDVLVRELPGGRELARFPRARVSFIATSPHGEQVAIADDRGGLELCVVATGHCGAPLAGHERAVSLTFDAEGERIVTVGLDQTIGVWGIDGGLRATMRDAAALHQALFTPLPDILVTTSDGAVRFWDLAKGNLIGELSVPAPWVALTPAGDQLAIGDATGVVSVRSLRADP
jgi:WD40 repeat protein